MKGFLLIVVSALAVNLCSSSWADDATKFSSPDGKFAMLLTENQKEAGRVKIELIDVDSRKVVLDLADSGHPTLAVLQTVVVAGFATFRLL
jgi:hypothetical protein